MTRAELLEQRPGWGGGKRWVTTISLEPLSEAESDELVDGLLGRTDMPARLREQIRNAAEGNPLFVEELLGKLIDDGSILPLGDGWSIPSVATSLVIPPTIHALLAARLDGLNGEERAVIERAAIEGKVFHGGGRGADSRSLPLRWDLGSPASCGWNWSDQTLRSSRGRRRTTSDILLIRDAAYQALAKQTRSELHEQYADWLQLASRERRYEYTEIIGYHLEQAYRYRLELGHPDPAAGALAVSRRPAGRRRPMRAPAGDTAAAVDLLERAVRLLPQERAREQRLKVGLGKALYDAGDSARAETLLVEAVTEADRAGDEGAGALAAAFLVVVRSSTRSTALAETASEFDRLSSVLARTGDLAGAPLTRSMLEPSPSSRKDALVRRRTSPWSSSSRVHPTRSGTASKLA